MKRGFPSRTLPVSRASTPRSRPPPRDGIHRRRTCSHASLTSAPGEVLRPPQPSTRSRALVDSGALLVQFVLDERDLLVLTAESSADGVIHRAHVVPVRRQLVAERVAQAVDPASLADAETWRKATADLVKLLPAPVLAQMSAARSGDRHSRRHAVASAVRSAARRSRIPRRSVRRFTTRPR